MFYSGELRSSFSTLITPSMAISKVVASLSLVPAALLWALGRSMSMPLILFLSDLSLTGFAVSLAATEGRADRTTGLLGKASRSSTTFLLHCPVHEIGHVEHWLRDRNSAGLIQQCFSSALTDSVSGCKVREDQSLAQVCILVVSPGIEMQALVEKNNLLRTSVPWNSTWMVRNLDHGLHSGIGLDWSDSRMQNAGILEDGLSLRISFPLAIQQYWMSHASCPDCILVDHICACLLGTHMVTCILAHWVACPFRVLLCPDWNPVSLSMYFAFCEPGPTESLIEKGVEWVTKQRKLGNSVYIHCAHGHGRSATLMCACLILEGKVNFIEDGVHFMKNIRPKVKLNTRQRLSLKQWLDKQKRESPQQVSSWTTCQQGSPLCSL